MQDSDFPPDEYFFVPIKKKSMYRFALMFPEAEVEDFVASIDVFYSSALDLIKRERVRRSQPQQQPSQPAKQPMFVEPPYVPARLSECAKELYR